MNAPPPDAHLLRLTLRGNAVFSSVSGLALCIAHRPVAGFIGVGHPWIVFVVGLSLLLFAFGLITSSERPELSPIGAKVAVALDLTWVVATVPIVSLGILSRGGNWAAVAIADIVLAFAILQLVGLRRLAETRGGRARQ